MIFKNNIRRKVMDVVTERIAHGQTKFDEGSTDIDTRLSEQIRAVTDSATKERTSLEDEIVRGIVGSV